MAPLWAWGAEAPSGTTSGESTSGTTPTVPGRLGGRAMTIANLLSTDAVQQITVTTPTALGDATTYERFYFRWRTKPTTSCRIWNVKGSVEGVDAAAFITIESDGSFKFWSKGNGTKTRVATYGTKDWADGLWHRMNLKYVFSNSNAGGSHAELDWYIDGDQMFTNYTAPYDAAIISGTRYGVQIVQAPGNVATLLGVVGEGLALLGQTAVTHYFGQFSGGERDGGEIDLDDWVGDTGAVGYGENGSNHRGPGAIVPLLVTGQGTYAAWDTNTSQWQRIVNLPPTAFNVTSGVGNSVRNAAKTSYTVATMDSVGIPSTAKVVSIRLMLYADGATNWNFIFRHNGAETTTAAQAAQSQKWLRVEAPAVQANGFGWWQDVSGVVWTTTDTIEVGMQDGTAGGGTKFINAALVIVDVDCADFSTINYAAGIRVQAGSSVGNGTVLSLTTDYEPDCVIVLPDTATSGAIWHRGMGIHGQSCQQKNGANTENVGICLTKTTGFVVKADAGDNVNINTINQRWIAITDPVGRVFRPGGRVPRSAANPTLDNYNFALEDATFLPLFVMASFQSYSAVAGQSWYVYGPGHSGGNASYLDQTLADTTDAIQSVSTGVIQFGTKVSSSNDQQLVVAAFRKTGYTTTRLVDIGNYTGDGGGSKVITLALDASPALILVVPATATARIFRHSADSTSRNWVTNATNATGITAMSQPSFTVGSSLNTSGTLYNWIALADGTDPPPSYDMTMGAGTIDSSSTTDIALTTSGSSPVVDEGSTAWKLQRFDVRPRQEEHR